MGLTISRTSTCSVTFPADVSLILRITEWLSAPVALALLINGAQALRYQLPWLGEAILPLLPPRWANLPRLLLERQSLLSRVLLTWRDPQAAGPNSGEGPGETSEPAPRSPSGEAPSGAAPATPTPVPSLGNRRRPHPVRLAPARTGPTHGVHSRAIKARLAATYGAEAHGSRTTAGPQVPLNRASASVAPGAIVLLANDDKPSPELVAALRGFQLGDHESAEAPLDPSPQGSGGYPATLHRSYRVPGVVVQASSPDASPGPALRPRPLRRPPKGCCVSSRSQPLG